jgi:predicted enzyme related to lactoylglutathione lyase
VVDLPGRFTWYELMTTDLKAATAFYAKVMGWGAWDASMPGRPYTLFSAGPEAVGGLMNLPADALRAGVNPNWIGYVAIEDLDAAAARITRLGGTVHVPPTDIGGISQFAVFSDPQSSRLGLFKWHQSARRQLADPAAPGRIGWHELLAADWEKAWSFYGELFGWQRAEAGVGETGTYQLFTAGGQTTGGMLTKAATILAPIWLYYFNVGDVDAVTKRVTAAGGRLVHGPVETPDGRWTVQCTDPQGALFGLTGKRRPTPPGYFAPAGDRGIDDK